MRDCLPDGWEHGDRVEHSSEIGERREDKVGNNRCRVKAIGYKSVEESDECEEERSEKRKEERETNMSKCYMSEEHRHTEHNCSCDNPTNNSSCDESWYDHPIWSWRYEDFFDRFLEFCHIKRRHHMIERVHDHRHHHESWHDELHIRESADHADTWSDELSEYDVVEGRRDDGWDYRLLPYSQESGYFFADDSRVGDPELGWIHGE